MFECPGWGGRFARGGTREGKDDHETGETGHGRSCFRGVDAFRGMAGSDCMRRASPGGESQEEAEALREPCGHLLGVQAAAWVSGRTGGLSRDDMTLLAMAKILRHESIAA